MKENERGRISKDEPEIPKIKLSEEKKLELDKLQQFLVDVKNGKYGEKPPVIDPVLAERIEELEPFDYELIFLKKNRHGKLVPLSPDDDLPIEEDPVGFPDFLLGLDEEIQKDLTYKLI